MTRGVVRLALEEPLMQRHAPIRPLWGCAACAETWSCRQARAELLAEYASGRLLGLDMADLLQEATADLTRLGPEPPDPLVMHVRFLGWVRKPTRWPPPIGG